MSMVRDLRMEVRSERMFMRAFVRKSLRHKDDAFKRSSLRFCGKHIERIFGRAFGTASRQVFERALGIVLKRFFKRAFNETLKRAFGLTSRRAITNTFKRTIEGIFECALKIVWIKLSWRPHRSDALLPQGICFVLRHAANSKGVFIGLRATQHTQGGGMVDEFLRRL